MLQYNICSDASRRQLPLSPMRLSHQYVLWSLHWGDLSMGGTSELKRNSFFETCSAAAASSSSRHSAAHSVHYTTSCMYKRYCITPHREFNHRFHQLSSDIGDYERIIARMYVVEARNDYHYGRSDLISIDFSQYYY